MPDPNFDPRLGTTEGENTHPPEKLYCSFCGKQMTIGKMGLSYRCRCGKKFWLIRSSPSLGCRILLLEKGVRGS